jgi:hypothetical protein
MVFTQDSVFLNLVRGEREHENYGVTHTLPYILVDENMRDNLLKTYQTKCRSCGNIHLDRVVSLGTSPLANNLKNSETEYSEVYPLEVNYCSNCHNCQLSVVVSPEKMFDNYLYVSSTASTFRKHFEEAAQLYMKQFNLNSTSLVIDIGSNDGIGLKTFKENGIRVLGIDPAKNIAELANKNGIPTLNEYFSDSTATYILQNYGKAKLITASNVFAHSDKLVEIANASFSILEDGGSFVVEVQYLLDTINDMTFDNVYHEHVNYWSVTSINNFFNKLGFTVYKVEHIDTHGGSIRVYVNKGNSAIDSSVSDFIQKEKAFGLTEKETYAKFGNNVETIKKIVNQNIQKLKEKYKIVAAYGSPAKATTSLNYFGINNSYIDYTIEYPNLVKLRFRLYYYISPAH